MRIVTHELAKLAPDMQLYATRLAVGLVLVVLVVMIRPGQYYQYVGLVVDTRGPVNGQTRKEDNTTYCNIR